MPTTLIILAALVTLEGLAVTLFPQTVKRAVESVSPGELRLAGIAELGVAAAVIYFAAAG
jgi:uncharacterized protein YjeT (DUF2065 family)